MFVYVPRPVLLSHNPVLRTTKLVPRHLSLDNSSVLSLRHYEQFIPPQTPGGGSRNTHASPTDVAVHGRRVTRDNFVVCSLSAIPLWPSVNVARRHSVVCRLRPSCRPRSAETTLLSAGSGRHVAHVVQRRLCCLPAPAVMSPT